MLSQSETDQLLKEGEIVAAKAMLNYQSWLNVKDRSQKEMFDKIEQQLDEYYQFGQSILDQDLTNLAIYDYQKEIRSQLQDPGQLNPALKADLEHQFEIINKLVKNNLI